MLPDKDNYDALKGRSVAFVLIWCTCCKRQIIADKRGGGEVRLYHYMKAEVLEKALTRDGLWVKASSPCDFNDPFECTGGVYGTPSRPFVEEFYASRPDQLPVACFYGDRADHVKKWLWRAFLDRSFLGQAYKISCFVDADKAEQFHGSDIRMWAHYADYGRGVRFELETEDLQFMPEVVRYESCAPKLDLSAINRIQELQDFIESCIKIKHKIWEPEEELRIIFRGPNDAVHYDPRIKMYRWPLPLNCIVEIAVGETLINSSQVNETVRHIRKAIQGAEQSISIVAATRNYNTYGLDYTPITLEA